VRLAAGFGTSGAGNLPAVQRQMVGWQKDVPQGGVVWVFAVAK
jgi:alcohol dehydrogenase (cytochrome c)